MVPPDFAPGGAHSVKPERLCAGNDGNTLRTTAFHPYRSGATSVAAVRTFTRRPLSETKPGNLLLPVTAFSFFTIIAQTRKVVKGNCKKFAGFRAKRGNKPKIPAGLLTHGDPFGAGNQNRTDDLVITNDVLYRLSHTSIVMRLCYYSRLSAVCQYLFAKKIHIF